MCQPLSQKERRTPSWKRWQQVCPSSPHLGGILEVVRDGETGLLVPPNDHNALAEAILKLRQDEALRIKLGKQAQKWVQEHHEVRRLPEQVIQVYNQVAAISPQNS